MCRIGRLLFFFLGVDYDKGIELLMYFYLLFLFIIIIFNDKFQI